MTAKLFSSAKKMLEEMNAYEWDPNEDTLKISLAPTDLMEPAQRELDRRYHDIQRHAFSKQSVIFDADDLQWNPGEIKMQFAVVSYPDGTHEYVDLRPPKMFDIETPVKMKAV